MRKIEIVEYQSQWIRTFATEKQLLEKTLGSIVHAIHHIGSTSVRGLAAKPIIDILLEVDSLEALDQKNDLLISEGYEPCGEFGIPGRRYFRKGNENRTHHVHAFLTGSEGSKRHLAFRDYLRTHPNIAADYGKVKTQVAATCNNDLAIYCNGKNDFVQSGEKNALSWQKRHLDAISSGTIQIHSVTDAKTRSEICETILRALPEWFGIEEAVLDYINDAKSMETIAAFAEDEVCGFICINEPNSSTAEIHVMGVLPHCQGKGLGKLLLEYAEKVLSQRGTRFLQVKTLSPSRESREYEQTRKFYEALGFCPVEEFKNLWGETNPCLQLIKCLNPAAGTLHHVEIYVSDLKKSEDFWAWLLCEKLGYKLWQSWEQGRSYLLGDTYIVFVQAEQRFLDVAFHRCRPGLNHLAFKAQSRAQVDEIKSDLAAKGCTILYKDQYPDANDDYYAVFFEDPDRIKVEIVV